MTTRAAALRNVLADGQWHSNSDLVDGGVGYRYGSIVQVVRNGWDGGPPLAIDVRKVTQNHFEYRMVGPGVARPRPNRAATLSDMATALREVRAHARGECSCQDEDACFLEVASLADDALTEAGL